MAEPLITDEMVNAAAEAQRLVEFGYHLGLSRLVDGVSTYTLTFTDGTPEQEFDDMDDAYAVIAEKKRATQARAALTAVAPAIRAQAFREEAAKADGYASVCRLLGDEKGARAADGIAEWLADLAEKETTR